MVNAKTIFGAVLMIILARAVPAPAQTIGDWVVDVNSKDVYSAVTVNESGHTFGEYCNLDEGNCYWLIETSSSCEEGATSPVLGNSNGEAVNLELVCMGRLEGGTYAYAFTDFAEVDDLVRHSDRVGFAMPVGNDEFSLVKYNLRGMVDALEVLLAATSDRLKSAPHNGRHNLI
jgi:hypothetical protein